MAALLDAVAAETAYDELTAEPRRCDGPKVVVRVERGRQKTDGIVRDWYLKEMGQRYVRSKSWMGNLLQQCNGSNLSEWTCSAILTPCQRYAVSMEMETLPNKDPAANEHANVCGKRIDERAENLEPRALASLADRSNHGDGVIPEGETQLG